MHALTQVQFHNDTLWAVEQDGSVLVAVKPICENLTIDWHGQRQRIWRDQLLSEGAVMIHSPSPGGLQETMCLPLDLLPGWLFGIDDRRIRDEATRAKVLDYKRHCYRVLYEHFFGKDERADNSAAAPDLGPNHDINTKARLVEIAERISGKAAARALWRELGLPCPAALECDGTPLAACDDEHDMVARFALEAIEKAPGIITPARTLWLAFTAWCEAANVINPGQNIFQTRFGRLGFAKRKTCGRSVYLGIRPNISKHLESLEEGRL